MLCAGYFSAHMTHLDVRVNNSQNSGQRGTGYIFCFIRSLSQEESRTYPSPLNESLC